MPTRPIRIDRMSFEAPNEGDISLSLLGAFELTKDAVPLSLPGSSQRLLAFLGIRGRPVTRTVVAGTLWPEASDARAQGSLRTLLSRLDDATRDAVEVNVLDLRLTEDVEVDLRDARALAHRLLIVSPGAPDADFSHAAIEALASELLPDWYDEWAVIEAEQWHQLRVRALEALAEQLTAAGRLVHATAAAQHIIAAEPMSESGYAALIRAQLAGGNRSAALSTFARCRAKLRTEMDVEPSPKLAALLTAGAPVVPPLPSTPAPDVATDVWRNRSSAVRRTLTAVAGEATEAFEVVASGISMEPTIRHGDMLLVSPDVELKAGRVMVGTHDGALIVKRLAMRDGKLVLRSDNANEEVELSAVEIQGIVVELRRTI